MKNYRWQGTITDYTLSGPWRKLTMTELYAALLQVGVEVEAANEYTDDPNSLPRNLRLKVNEYFAQKE